VKDLDPTGLISCTYRVDRTIPNVIQYPANSVNVMVQAYETCRDIVQVLGSLAAFNHDDVVPKIGLDQRGDDRFVDR